VINSGISISGFTSDSKESMIWLPSCLKIAISVIFEDFVDPPVVSMSTIA
jgi:hypothetical protein